jgi:FolB domain-containing protein
VIQRIHIRDLEVRCIVGILPDERVNEQNIYLDVDIDYDFSAAAAADDIAQTVDYAEVSKVLADWIRETQALLIERIAIEGGDLILERWPQVPRVQITVKKPDAVAETRHVAVTAERIRS